MIYFPERKLAPNLFVALGDVKNAEPLNRQLIDFAELFSTRASISHPRRQILNEISFVFFFAFDARVPGSSLKCAIKCLKSQRIGCWLRRKKKRTCWAWVCD